MLRGMLKYLKGSLYVITTAPAVVIFTIPTSGTATANTT